MFASADLDSYEVETEDTAGCEALWFYALEEDDELVFQIQTFQDVLLNWCHVVALLNLAGFLERRLRDTALRGRFGDRIQVSNGLVL